MRNRRTTSILAASALVVTGLAGVAVATGAQADQDTLSHKADTLDGDRQGPPMGRGGPGRGMNGELGHKMLHGEIVVETEDGTSQIQLVQRGQVTATDATSLTVASSDGFTATYVLTADTVQHRDREDGTAQVGDTAHVKAQEDGTADLVVAMSAATEAQMMQHRAAMQEWMNNRPEGAQKPSGQRS